MKLGTVQKINLNDKDPNLVNSITVSSNSGGVGSNIECYPLSMNFRQIPVIGEQVYIVVGSDAASSAVARKAKNYYLSPVSLQFNVNHNSLPKLNYLQPGTSAGAAIAQSSAGIPARASTDSSVNFGNGFVESPNVSQLQGFLGDVILEGRFGQSIRFGYTPRNVKKTDILVDGATIEPTWTSTTPESPITIFRNGQSPTTNDDGWIPITENIKTDLSSIYLTSYQKLPFSIANENFVSYTTPPISPSSFTHPQIILNSDRVILNAKSDSVLISGEKSVGLSSNNSINIEAKEVFIEGRTIRLGSKDTSQSILKGDDAVELLKSLTTEISNLATALKTIQMWPGGNPTPDPTIQPVASVAETNLNKIKAQLDNLKSNFVKTI